MRVGINAGPAAVGLVGGVDEQTVAFGDTTNVAARLQSLAAPGTVVVGEEAARRLAHRFVLDPLGKLSVRGRTKQVEVLRLVGPLRPDDETRSAAPLVGRAAEVDRLRTAAAELEAGRGQVLLVAGDAGIGKSRLLERAPVDPPGRGHVAGGPLPLVRRPAHLAVRGDAAPLARGRRRGARDRVAHQGAGTAGALLGPGLDEALAPLGRLLRVRLDPDATRRIPPATSRPRRCAGRSAPGSRRSPAHRPVVVAVDDLHWAFPDARELAESLLELTDRAAVLLVATLRLDSASEALAVPARALGDFAHRTVELRLGPLSGAEAVQLVHDRAAGALDDADDRGGRRRGPREIRCSSRSSCGCCSRGRASSGAAHGR